MDNRDEIIQLLEAVEHQLRDIRGDVRVLREESEKHTDVLDMIQAVGEAT